MADDCYYPPSLQKLQDVMWLVAYYISMPLYFVVGIGGNVMLLIAFYKQAKQEKAYAYQIFLTLSKLCEIFTFSLFMGTYKWFSGIESSGSGWYMSNYPLMFFATHMASPIFNCFIMVSLFLSVAMTADRVFALGKTFVYKNINHSRHQLIAVVACVFIGVSTNVFEVKRWTLHQVGTGANTSYRGEFDEVYLKTEIASAFGHLRTTVRLVGVAALVVLNVAMVMIFRGHTKKVGQMIAGDKREHDRKAADKILLILTICQSCLMCFSQIPHSSHLIASFASANYGPCYGRISGPFVDTCIQIGDAADFFVVIAVNKRMRQAVFGMIPCMRGGNATSSGVGGNSMISRRAQSAM